MRLSRATLVRLSCDSRATLFRLLHLSLQHISNPRATLVRPIFAYASSELTDFEEIEALLHLRDEDRAVDRSALLVEDVALHEVEEGALVEILEEVRVALVLVRGEQH